jgi:hypothetical protein
MYLEENEYISSILITITNSAINNSKEKFISHFYFLNSIKILETLDNRSYFLLKCKNY